MFLLFYQYNQTISCYYVLININELQRPFLKIIQEKKSFEIKINRKDIFAIINVHEKTKN